MSQAEQLSPSLPVEDVHQPELEGATVDFDRQWQQSLFRPLLITLLLGCVVTAGTYVFVVVVPPFTETVANTIILCSALAAFTACIAGAMSWEASRDLMQSFKYRIVEPVGWALILRFGLWFVMGGPPPVLEILTEPLTAIFDGTYIAGSLLVLLTWLLANHLNRSLLALSLRKDEVSHITRAYGRLSDNVENTLRSDRRGQLDRFVAVWIGMGIVVIVLAGGSQVRLPEGERFPTILAQNIPPRAIVSTVVYFLAGFLLIGQAYLVAMRARWALDGVAVEEHHFRNWMRYVVSFVVLVALITSLVPVGETILLFKIITFIGAVMATFMLYLMGAVNWLLNLLGRSPPQEEAALPQRMEMPELLPTEEEIAVPANDLNIPTLIFWAFVAVAALIGGYHLLAARGFDWSWIRARIRNFLVLFQRTVDAGWRIVIEVVNQITGLELARESAAERKARQNMTINEQVQFAYLSILDAAAQRGTGRRAAETPRHYAPRLAASLAAEEAVNEANNEETNEEASSVQEQEMDWEVKNVTESFYKARYSQEVSGEQDLTRVQALLRQVRDLWPITDEGKLPTVTEPPDINVRTEREQSSLEEESTRNSRTIANRLRVPKPRFFAWNQPVRRETFPETIPYAEPPGLSVQESRPDNIPVVELPHVNAKKALLYSILGGVIAVFLGLLLVRSSNFLVGLVSLPLIGLGPVLGYASASGNASKRIWVMVWGAVGVLLGGGILSCVLWPILVGISSKAHSIITLLKWSVISQVISVVVVLFVLAPTAFGQNPDWLQFGYFLYFGIWVLGASLGLSRLQDEPLN